MEPNALAQETTEHCLEIIDTLILLSRTMSGLCLDAMETATQKYGACETNHMIVRQAIGEINYLTKTVIPIFQDALAQASIGLAKKVVQAMNILYEMYDELYKSKSILEVSQATQKICTARLEALITIKKEYTLPPKRRCLKYGFE